MKHLFDFFVAHKRVIPTVFLQLVVVLALVGGLVLVLKETSEVGAVSPSTQSKAMLLPTQPNAISGVLQVRGNQIVDASGHSVVLRGAHVTSAFAYMRAWRHGADPFIALNPTVFR